MFKRIQNALFFPSSAVLRNGPWLVMVCFNLTIAIFAANTLLQFWPTYAMPVAPPAKMVCLNEAEHD